MATFNNLNNMISNSSHHCIRVFLTILLLALFSSCINKEYSVTTSGHTIYIEIPSRSVGITGIDKVSYGNLSSLDVIAKSVYDEFHGIKGIFKNGSYDVYLKTRYRNKFGEIEYSDKGKICTLETEVMKRYQSEYYFAKDFTTIIDQSCRTTKTIKKFSF